MDELQNIPWGLVAPFLTIHLILLIIALMDCIRAEETRGAKWLWIPVIIFISLFGSILYFVLGRRQH